MPAGADGPARLTNMLLGVPPLLSPDLLHALASMGHGDEIALVDANFPAASHARRLIEMPGVTSSALLDAVLAVMALDTFVSPAGRDHGSRG